MSVVLSDISVLGFSDSASAENVKAEDLKALFVRLACPNLETLRFTLFVNKASTTGACAEIEEVLYKGIYPSLQVLEGGLIASPGVSADHFQAIQQRLQLACEVADIDCSRLTFISHEEEDDGEEWHTDDDESVMSDEGADRGDDMHPDASVQDDAKSGDYAESDGGDSGYAVVLGSPGPLRQAGSVKHGVHADLSDYGSMEESTESDTSCLSQSSCLTDEDEILSAFTTSVAL